MSGTSPTAPQARSAPATGRDRRTSRTVIGLGIGLGAPVLFIVLLLSLLLVPTSAIAPRQDFLFFERGDRYDVWFQVSGDRVTFTVDEGVDAASLRVLRYHAQTQQVSELTIEEATGLLVIAGEVDGVSVVSRYEAPGRLFFDNGFLVRPVPGIERTTPLEFLAWVDDD